MDTELSLELMMLNSSTVLWHLIEAVSVMHTRLDA